MSDWQDRLREAVGPVERRRALRRMLKDVPLTVFLAGSTDKRVVVDPIFGKSLTRILDEASIDEPEAIAQTGDGCVSGLLPDGMTLQECGSGWLAFDGSRPVGGYVGCDLAVDVAYQGKGVGSTLIAWMFVLNEELPTWWLDKASFSPAGLACHRGVWRRLTQDVAWTTSLVKAAEAYRHQHAEPVLEEGLGE